MVRSDDKDHVFWSSGICVFVSFLKCFCKEQLCGLKEIQVEMVLFDRNYTIILLYHHFSDPGSCSVLSVYFSLISAPSK